MRRINLTIVASLSLLTGCASMDKDQCETADWQSIGFEDGIRGKHQANIREYRQDCAKHGITPNLESYRLGHGEGSKTFCTASNGFEIGKRNGDYEQSCPPQLAAQFLAGFKDGKRLFGLSARVSGVKNEIAQLSRDVQHIEKTLAVKNELLVADGLNKEQRIVIRDEIKALYQEKTELNLIIPELYKDLDLANAEYNQAYEKLGSKHIDK